MGYKLIDDVIKSWAEEHNLKLFTMDRDWEVRSFRINDSVKRGRNYQIWIEEPKSTDDITVNLKNYSSPNQTRKYKCSKGNLKSQLDEALRVALGS